MKGLNYMTRYCTHMEARIVALYPRLPRIASKFATVGSADFEDLVGIGALRIVEIAPRVAELGDRATAYLYTAARNAMIDALRKQHDADSLDEEREDGLSLGDTIADENDPFFAVNNDEDIEWLLSSLPARSREVVARRSGLDGYEPQRYRGIAADMGLAYPTVKMMGSRAYAQLRELLRQGVQV